MKKLSLHLFLMLALMPCLVNAADKKWYRIGTNDIVIADLKLQPSQKQVVTIKSTETKEIWIQSEMKQDDWEKMQKGQYPIQMKQVGTSKSILTYYGGLKFDPIKGTIKIEVMNVSKKPYKVLVFQPQAGKM
ncbi:hypothetical protein L4X63_05975 [Geomonas sp. Red32]|uniref:hypothetical protein n=1 Tax=Geomonas sp. Red32 TaxID=2912856 RepID=UPI00202CB937|nr:hypothetical protein [Geomonas sp. Red32]MCM0081133.1 hypothetical protein [Geomonas sp. Red32]